MLLETCIKVHILFRHPAEACPVRTTASVCQCTKKTITSVSAKGSGEKTAKAVRKTREYGATFELAECVLISVAWSLAATDEERNVDIFKPTCPSQAIIIQLCYVSFNGKFTAAPNEGEIKNKLI